MPNYQDFGTNLVNSGDPIWGTLEIGQATVALLNRRLGGNFLETLLREGPAWDSAAAAYRDLLNVRRVVHQAESNEPGSDGETIPRENASREIVWHLANAGNQVSFDIPIHVGASYELSLRYSNDDAGPGDEIVVLLDAVETGSFTSIDTGSWDQFVESPSIPLGDLLAPSASISVEMRTTDGPGIDLDRIRLLPEPSRLHSLACGLVLLLVLGAHRHRRMSKPALARSPRASRARIS